MHEFRPTSSERISYFLVPLIWISLIIVAWSIPFVVMVLLFFLIYHLASAYDFLTYRVTIQDGIIREYQRRKLVAEFPVSAAKTYYILPHKVRSTYQLFASQKGRGLVLSLDRKVPLLTQFKFRSSAEDNTFRKDGAYDHVWSFMFWPDIPDFLAALKRENPDVKEVKPPSATI